MNMSIPQMFKNNLINNKQSKDDKDKRIILKYQAFILWIKQWEMMVGLFVDQDTVWITMCN